MEVHGEGKKESKVWLIGEAPGQVEEREGRPFVGGAGTLLNGCLQEAGIQRSDCYIDNVIKERPEKNDFRVFYKDKGRKQPKDCLLSAQRRVREEIIRFRPNIVVTLGNESLQAVMGHKEILNWRGSILNFSGVKVIPVIHPAMALRQYIYRSIISLDLTRVKEQSISSTFSSPYRDNFIINPSFEKVMKTLKWLEESAKYIAFDIETDRTNQILCLGLGWSEQDSICIPITYAGSSWWTKEEEIAIIKEISNLFRSPKIGFIAQNAQYDMIWMLDKWGIAPTNFWMDTMNAFHCVYPEMKKALSFLCSIYTLRPYYKGMPGSGGADVLWKYNCLDTVVTWECAMKIRKELQEYGTFEFYKKHSHATIVPLIAMQRQGVRIDVERRKAVDLNLSKEKDELQGRLDKAVGYPLNPASPKQMANFLYKELKLPVQRNRSTGAVTANDEALETLFKRFPNPVFNLIKDIRHINKLLSTYVRASLDEDGRIRCNYKITGTETGRLSSTKSVYGKGTNLQNIPRGNLIRGFFIADPGKLLVNADLSQAEARVVAYISGESRLQALFEKGGDIHRANAAMVYGVREIEVKPSQRQIAKVLVHAANYGIGARKFAKEIGSTENRARELLNQYYANYPSIKLWHREVEAQLRKSRVLSTPMGRKRTFFGRWSPDLIREAIAYVPQSTVSDILNWGIIEAFKNLPPEWDLMLQVHDSILMQVPDWTDHMHIYKFIKHYFEIGIEMNRNRVKIPVDIKIGKNWGELKEMEV